MRTQSSDTSPEIEKIMLDMLRSQTISERISKTMKLTSSAIYLSKRAIARANPGKSKRELDLLFVKYHYGDKLAGQLEKYLEGMNNGKK